METIVPVWFEVTSLSILIAILLADLALIVRRPHIPTMREASIWVGVYVSLALVFAAILIPVAGIETSKEFVAGWLTEYSLSIDNLFVFVLILGSLAVPYKYQQRALMVGILLALVFRGAFILVGAELIERYIWVFYIFGAWLVWTAWQQVKPVSDEGFKDGFLVKMVKKFLPYSEEYDGGRMTTMIDGKRLITPMLLVYIALGSTDVLFALDSIPAIFGITQNAFIVFSANLFALMGLRQLYFLLGGLLERLEYLKYGIAAILAFIGVKLVLHAMVHNSVPFLNGGEAIPGIPEISTTLSLAFIIFAMIVATVASLIKVRHDDKQKDKRFGRGAAGM